MVSIRKRAWRTANGRQRSAWLVDFIDGNAKRKAKQFASQGEARNWVRQTNFTELSEDIAPSVDQVCDEWLIKCRSENLERSTLENYEYMCDRYIRPAFGTGRIDKVTRMEVITARKGLNERKSVSLGNRFVSTLKMVFLFAQDSEYLGKNVLRRLKSQQSKRHRSRVKIPTVEEMERIFDVCDRQSPSDSGVFRREMLSMSVSRDEVQRFACLRRKAMFHTFAGAGLRGSEMRGLPWRDFDLVRKTITVTQRCDKYNKIGAVKTAAALRTIEIDDDLVIELAEWQRLCADLGFELVFPTYQGRPMAFGQPIRDFAKLQRRARVTAAILDSQGEPVLDAKGRARHKTKYTPHHLRHWRASKWIEQRINLKKLSMQMGHSSFQVTFDLYGHLIEAAERADQLTATVSQHADEN